MDLQIINIRTIDSGFAGKLSFFESEKDIPFEIKRIYYVHDVPIHAQRGGHAHKSLRQFLFCPYGKIELILDDGKSKESVFLDSPSIGIIIEPEIWHDMIWHKHESILCVAASDYYNESDYIRHYDKFIDFITKKAVEEND